MQGFPDNLFRLCPALLAIPAGSPDFAESSSSGSASVPDRVFFESLLGADPLLCPLSCAESGLFVRSDPEIFLVTADPVRSVFHKIPIKSLRIKRGSDLGGNSQSAEKGEGQRQRDPRNQSGSGKPADSAVTPLQRRHSSFIFRRLQNRASERIFQGRRALEIRP